MARRRSKLPYIAIFLALWILLLGLPIGAQDTAIERMPLCREDGICLPAPRLASEVVLDLRPEAPQALESASPCDTPLLIKRQAEVDPRTFQRMLQHRGYTQIEGLLTPQWWRVCLPAASAAAQAQAVAALEALPEVALVEPDGIALAAWTPNDPYYDAQWALPRIDAPAAWNTTQGSSGVMIAVVDSGIDYYHPDSPEDLWLGWDFVYDTEDPYDDYGHGTHVMGIAAARANNGAGVAGLCPGCSVLAIKVLDSTGRGSWSQVADGIVQGAYAPTVLGKRVIINLSLGGYPNTEESTAIIDAIAYAHARGALVVAAAGNYGPAAPMFPASLPGVIAVSASDRNDRTDSYTLFSQFGDIAAPGEFVYSTWNDATSVSSPQPVCVGASEFECYKYESGTSMAAPHVSAAAGLVWSLHPEYSSFQVKLALLRNVDVPGDWNPLYGVGRLNVERAVTAPEIVLKHVYLPLTVR